MSGPRRLDFRAWGGSDEDLRDVVRHLESGGLVAYPTETVYGFGGLVQEEALRRLAELKPRDPEKPYLLLVPHTDSIRRLAWTPAARELAGVFWPGALTLVLEDPSESFPLGVRSSGGGVAVRRSSHPLARRLVELLNAPITSTSANAPGAPPAASGEEALAAAAALGAGEELWVLDFGALPASASSTIVDCTGASPRVLRAGQTPVKRLRCVLPGIDSLDAEPHGPDR
jgi:L-threonylcarbamoyladenylate synthase